MLCKEKLNIREENLKIDLQALGKAGNHGKRLSPPLLFISLSLFAIPFFTFVRLFSIHEFITLEYCENGININESSIPIL